MKTTGLVLDFYDDVSGKLLKESFPTADALPDIVKTAHILSSEEREVLRDEAYALVMVNEGKVMRKFACVDAGNTLLSALYFVENADSLPEEAQKIAAANILASCEEFGLPIKDLEKLARKAPPKAEGRGAARTRDPMLQPVAGDESNWAERTNLISVRGGADSGRVIPTASQMKTAHYQDSRVDGLTESEERVQKDKKKGEQVDYLDSFHKLNPGSKPAKHNRPKKKEKVANILDVSALEPVYKVKKATATHMALGHYPLDSFEDVQAAVRFFSESYHGFSPTQRHEFAVKTAARANDLHISIPPVLERYGSTEYAPDVEAHLANRRALAPEHNETWNDLQEKRASIEPEEFVELLSEADEVAGLNWHYDGHVSDPFFATFGGDRVKEANAAWTWQSRTGDFITAEQLKKLALNGRPLVEKQFDSSIALAFAKSPISIFESLPDTHKIIMARLASQEFDGLPTN